LAAADHAGSVKPLALDESQIADSVAEMLAPFARTEGESPYQLHRELQETMQQFVGIFRSEEDLERGLAEIRSLKERAGSLRVEGSRLFNPGWHLARDLKSMLTVSEAVALSALARRESRGAHSRIDYPNYDETWGMHNNVIDRDGDKMTLNQTSIPDMPPDLKEILAE
jgi:succinate dehydrogenase / fumarate reductase flavoprotein subunit